jgi:hypothetical protein
MKLHMTTNPKLRNNLAACGEQRCLCCRIYLVQGHQHAQAVQNLGRASGHIACRRQQCTAHTCKFAEAQHHAALCCTAGPAGQVKTRLVAATAYSNSTGWNFKGQSSRPAYPLVQHRSMHMSLPSPACCICPACVFKAPICSHSRCRKPLWRVLKGCGLQQVHAAESAVLLACACQGS